MPEDLDSLYLITDRNVPEGGDLLGALRAALRGGVRFLQFREKDLPARARYELGRDVVRLAGEFGARVVVNGDPALALALGAAGVHLGKGTLPAGVVRERLGFAGLIGYSAHSGAEAAEAFSAGADFATLSPVFSSRSKSAALPLLGDRGLSKGDPRFGRARLRPRRGGRRARARLHRGRGPRGGPHRGDPRRGGPRRRRRPAPRGARRVSGRESGKRRRGRGEARPRRS